MATSPPPPLSPAGVPLEDCIEELIKFTLVSSSKGKINTDLSTSYCDNLIRDDPSNPIQNEQDGFKGVPSYPLYKRLASSLYQSIHSEKLCAANKELIPVHENPSLERKEDEWNNLISEKGSALMTMLTEVDFELHVQEPFFSHLNDGLKIIEGRCAVGHYKRIKSGDILLLNKCLMLQVQNVHQYATFREMLESESLENVLPGVRSIEQGVQIYRNFYSEEKELSNGVLAICVKKTTSQLYDTMASILSGLSYEGIQRLLGFAQTIGTVPESLPPPISTLMSTFLEPHNTNVKGSTLTDGARALAKHVNRSSKRNWGNLCGNDSEKNMRSANVINRLLTHSTWLNMHIVPPHGTLFEIRDADGYGARWSEDGTKFIGFLEPYMVDGHSKGWKH